MSLLNIFSTKKASQEYDAQNALGQANDLINLSMNPNDPRYQAMVNNQSQGIRQGFLQQLRDTVEANRRQALMGRQQFFDPERRDETMFSAVNKAGQQAQIQARGDVLNNINGAIQRLQGQSSGYLGLADRQNARNEQNRQAMLAMLGAGAQLGSAAMGKPPASLGVM